MTETVRKGPIDGAGQAVSLTWEMLGASVSGLAALPSRLEPLARSLVGGTRSADDPMSVVGATRIGGELASNQGVSGIGPFLAILAGFNVFIGLFNLVPLPPLDGGHLAVTWFERIRSALARRAGRPEPGMVDRNRLVPLTLGVIVVLGAFTLLTVSADIINPVRLG
jgi:membrane-associated protease RseP (regulator of RpoE activity)